MLASLMTFLTLFVRYFHQCRALRDCHLDIEEDFHMDTSLPFFSPDYNMDVIDEPKAEEELPDYQEADQAFAQYLDFE